MQIISKLIADKAVATHNYCLDNNSFEYELYCNLSYKNRNSKNKPDYRSRKLVFSTTFFYLNDRSNVSKHTCPF